MTTSLSNHGRSAHPADGFDEDPYGGDNPCEARLRGLDRQQLADRLNWLSWYQPGIFAAVMDYGKFSDDLTVDTDPTDPDSDHAEDPVPTPNPRPGGRPRTQSGGPQSQRHQNKQHGTWLIPRAGRRKCPIRKSKYYRQVPIDLAHLCE